MDDNTGIKKRTGGIGFFASGGSQRSISLEGSAPIILKGDSLLAEAVDVSEYFSERSKSLS
jgi:DNA/RNA endonuclease YhcR with UshA esterase domain